MWQLIEMIHHGLTTNNSSHFNICVRAERREIAPYWHVSSLRMASLFFVGFRVCVVVFFRMQQSIVPKDDSQKGMRYPQLDGWNMLDFINRTGFKLDDILLECTYRGIKCTDTIFWKTVGIAHKRANVLYTMHTRTRTRTYTKLSKWTYTRTLTAHAYTNMKTTLR